MMATLGTSVTGSRARRSFLTKGFLGGLIGLTAVVAGCGPREPPTGEVSGVVTIEGVPVSGLIVQFEPQDGVRLGLPPAYGVTNESGRYRAMLRGQRPGAAVGLNHVRITPAERDGVPAPAIHARYAGDYTFWYEVAPGANTYDIELKADPLKKVPVAK